MNEEELQQLSKKLVLIVGFGRTGHYAAEMLDPDLSDVVIVDNNREKIEHLRSLGFHAIAGDATDRDILLEAQIERASAILITVPDPFDARRIVEHVKDIRPETRILVRSRNDEETRFFETQEVELAIVGTQEIARRMVDRLMEKPA
jgi:CPA2 family monovalent cation:H+ antiporter-2